MARTELCKTSLARALFYHQRQVTRLEIGEALRISGGALRSVLRTLMDQGVVEYSGSKTPKRLSCGQMCQVKIYRATAKLDADFTAPRVASALPKAHKTLRDVQPNAVRAHRSRNHVAAIASGYPALHFTAPFRAPSEELPTGFPPFFQWDAARGYVPPPAIALLQATLRRPMTRESA